MSWGQPENLWEEVRTAGLMPASVAYAAGSYMRTVAYATRLLKRERLPIPVVSVGNLTCGGTGKTPVTIDIANRLAEAGWRPAVLSRGYRRQSKVPYLVLEDDTSAQEAGDEPVLIHQNLPAGTVIVGARRAVTGRLAVELGCNVAVLDDGFQHIQLARNYDVVLVDYNDNPERDSVLPSGRLREPIVALGRATSVVIARAPEGLDAARVADLRSMIRKHNPHADITVCKFRPYADVDLAGARVVAFAGIARPSGFQASVSQLGATLTAFEKFPDHHWYTVKDVHKLANLVRTRRADLIVTTEKDRVKLPREFFAVGVPIVTVRQRTVWLGEPPQAVTELIGQSGQARASNSSRSLVGNASK